MNFGSLFSGIGGLDLGLERCGFRCVWQVEINEFCRKVLAKHWPNVARHDDVRTFDPSAFAACDLVAGGFPCKQTSCAAAVHGRRNGLDGSDSGLWHEMLRIIREAKPANVIVENVAGVSTWSAEIEGGLEAAGYAVSRLPLSAQGVGAPHLRRRVFFLANAHGKRLPESRQGGPPEAEREPGGAADGDAWLSSLPGVLRVADGVPGGVDRRERIVALGNSVVPAMGEAVGRALLQLQ